MSTTLEHLLYEGDGTPIAGSEPFISAIHVRPVCRIVNQNEAWAGGEVERIWCLPNGVSPLPVPVELLRELVAALDAEQVVAVHSDSIPNTIAAIDAVLDLAGGGHA